MCNTINKTTIQGIDGGDHFHIMGNIYSGMTNYGNHSDPNTPTGGTAYIFYATNGNNFSQHKIRKPC